MSFFEISGPQTQYKLKSIYVYDERIQNET